MGDLTTQISDYVSLHNTGPYIIVVQFARTRCINGNPTLHPATNSITHSFSIILFARCLGIVQTVQYHCRICYDYVFNVVYTSMFSTLGHIQILGKQYGSRLLINPMTCELQEFKSRYPIMFFMYHQHLL